MGLVVTVSFPHSGNTLLVLKTSLVKLALHNSQLSINRQMDQHNVVHPASGIRLSHKVE